MNPLPPNFVIGTMGELLVQLHLLRFGVQAAPPLKDSGNDLIALRGTAIKAIQVKTRQKRLRSFGDLPSRYHLLAVVIYDKRKMSERNTQQFRWDEVSVYLFDRDTVDHGILVYDEHRLSEELINRYWPHTEGTAQ